MFFAAHYIIMTDVKYLAVPLLGAHIFPHRSSSENKDGVAFSELRSFFLHSGTNSSNSGRIITADSSRRSGSGRIVVCDRRYDYLSCTQVYVRPGRRRLLSERLKASSLSRYTFKASSMFLETPRRLRNYMFPNHAARKEQDLITETTSSSPLSDANNLLQKHEGLEEGHGGVDALKRQLLPKVCVQEENVAGEKPDVASFFHRWSSITEKLAASATFAFLLLQLPQIILNTQNLLAANYTALFAVPWMGLLTGLLGNLSLLSYFAGKKEKGAMIVQAVGVLSTFVVQLQLTIAGAMPVPAFIAIGNAVLLGYILNILNYNLLLSNGFWKAWQDIITIGGFAVLPQVIWSTFDSYLPTSPLPGIIALLTASALVLLDRMKKLPKRMEPFMGGLAAWSATLLFMWAPVAQLWTNIENSSNIHGLSVLTVLLGTIGNSLLLPRALFTRDLMWFIGSSWGVLLQGWGILLTMYIYNCISPFMFLGVSFCVALWLGGMLVFDSKAYSLSSPAIPLVELFIGCRGAYQ